MSYKSKIQQFLGIREIKVGLLMLVLSVALALISMYPSHEKLVFSGSLNQGDEIILSEIIPSGNFVEGELILKAKNSEVAVIMHADAYREFTVQEKRIFLKNPEISLKSVEGSVDYTVKANMVFYPFSRLSYLALIIMISGSIIVNIGLLKVFSELM